jgi:hypothetical protein
MATELDKKLIPKVKDIVERFGKLVKFKVTKSGTINPATGDISGSTESTFEIKVTPPQDVFTPRELGVLTQYTDNDVVKIGDTQIYLPAKDLDFVPIEGMRVVIENELGTDEEWEVIRIGKIYTGDDVALYGMQLRQ